jgi:hypothetical protein
MAVAWIVAAAVTLGCDSRPLEVRAPGDGGAGGSMSQATHADGGPAATPAGSGPPATPADGGPAAPATVPLPAGVTPVPYVNVAHQAGTCETAAGGTSVATASAAEAASLLVGRWRRCSGSSSVLGIAPHDGMELARDRSWRLLVKAGDSLTPATGFDTAGRWYMSAEDPNDMVVREQSVVRILPNGAGANGYPVEFLQQPSVMRLGHTLTYVWLGE